LLRQFTERKKAVNKKTKTKYSPELAGLMYRFFIGYEDRGAPSFQKFARSVGLTTADIESMRRHKTFNSAYLECQQIRRDYLIDRALDKRFDSSFTKFLLTLDGEAESNDSGDFTLHLEVVDK
jgi:hypothetical protein